MKEGEGDKNSKGIWREMMTGRKECERKEDEDYEFKNEGSAKKKEEEEERREKRTKGARNKDEREEDEEEEKEEEK
ncbi:hypothetical protein Pcinc_043762 [Petrolisthes cinctipes]|uniref:Uncharacterized protein n=1 Tax=Petrolisthes cinctipes TaxID=88211 RepID=A0AAE1BG17_PETCI|nr:hypothetical protein Pcinc_043762 [Petrolisthes cinctipes]